MHDCLGLTELPAQFGRLSKLHTLHLVGCSSIRALPPSMAEMRGLRHLYFAGHEMDAAAGIAGADGELWGDTRDGYLTRCSAVQSMPDLSQLAELKVTGLPRHLKPWEEGGYKAFSLAAA